MRIANIILTSQYGGAEQVFIDYMVMLKKIGHEVLAIVKHDAPYANQILELGIEVKKIRNDFGFHDFFAVGNLKKILIEFNADITLSHAGRATALMRKAIKKVPNKHIFEICVNHSMNVKRSIGANMLISISRPIFYRTIDLGQDPTTSFMVLNATDVDCDKIKIPQIALQNKKQITLGVIGRADRTKGFQHAIALMKLLQNYPDREFILKISSKGYYLPKLKQLAEKLGVTSQVQFLGRVESKEEFFASIDVLLMTSEEENFGLVILEAMKNCVPLISTNSDGAKEILRPEIDAKIIEINPLESIDQRLKQAVLEMISDDKKTNEMVRNAVERLREKFTYAVLERSLRDLMGEPKNKNF
jgi:glycosyltransferase involved in cell wall biosynthesis